MSRKGRRMKPHRIKAVMLRHTYEARRNLDRVIDMLYWPVLDIVVWGFFTIYLGRGGRMQPGMINFMLGAVILWGLFFGFQRDMAVGFLDELWSRNLVNLFSTPLSVSEYMTGLIAVNVLKAAVGMMSAALMSPTSTPAISSSGIAGNSICQRSSSLRTFAIATRQLSACSSTLRIPRPARRAISSSTRWLVRK